MVTRRNFYEQDRNGATRKMDLKVKAGQTWTNRYILLWGSGLVGVRKLRGRCGGTGVRVGGFPFRGVWTGYTVTSRINIGWN